MTNSDKPKLGAAAILLGIVFGLVAGVLSVTPVSIGTLRVGITSNADTAFAIGIGGGVCVGLIAALVGALVGNRLGLKRVFKLLIIVGALLTALFVIPIAASLWRIAVSWWTKNPAGSFEEQAARMLATVFAIYFVPPSLAVVVIVKIIMRKHPPARKEKIGRGMRRLGLIFVAVGFILLLAKAASFQRASRPGFWEGGLGRYSEWGKAAGSAGCMAIAAGLTACCLGGMIVWRYGRKRRKPGHCACGYNLTGNVSGRCPECGEAASR